MGRSCPQGVRRGGTTNTGGHLPLGFLVETIFVSPLSSYSASYINEGFLVGAGLIYESPFSEIL